MKIRNAAINDLAAITAAEELYAEVKDDADYTAESKQALATAIQTTKDFKDGIVAGTTKQSEI